MTPAEDAEFIRNVARRYWPTDWEETRCGEENPLGFPQRCSVVGRNFLKTQGEELPGSWHQQANGGVRYWTAVSGEINTAS